MKHIDLLLPFALPPVEMARDLLKAIKAPSLAMLLSRSAAKPVRHHDAFARRLPHEAWLAERLCLAAQEDTGGSPAAAAAMMRRQGIEVSEGTWFAVHPVHIHIARDHLVLTDARNLVLPDAQSRALFDIARAVFADAGKTLVYADAHTWYLRADDWSELATATPDAACGHNIDIWMPTGTNAREWRRLQNEVQMCWHGHAINGERERNGLQPVNSLWIWGGAPAQRVAGCAWDAAALEGWAAATLPPAVKRPALTAGAAALLEATQTSGLAMPETLIHALLAKDWAAWLEAMEALEAAWFAPLLSVLESGDIGSVGLVLTDDTRLLELRATRWHLKRFWTRPSYARLTS